MPFPIVLTRTVRLNLKAQGAMDVGLVLDRLEDGLANLHARRVQRTGRVNVFEAGIACSLSGWSLLALITSGSIEVAEDSHGARITYRLTFTELFLTVTALVAAMDWVLLSSSEVQFPKLETTLSLAGIWAWMVWGNSALALRRFSRFLERQLAP